MKNIFCLFIILISFFANSQSKKLIKDTISDKTPYTAVETMPQYYGGQEAMFKFIAENLEYPSDAVNSRIEGRVFVKFTIKENGMVADVHVISKDKLGYGCEEAAVAVIEKMPRWKPGLQNGIPVSVYYNLPIRFRMN